jgi:sugar/nucleoside kinase (ribokinase family)
MWMAMSMPADVLVVGDLMVDVVVFPEGPLNHGSDTAASIRSVGGGAAANTACWLAHGGRSVRLVAAVGDDGIGLGAVDELEATGAEFAGWRDPAHPTGTCVVLIDPTGERTMLPDRGANDHLPPAVVRAAFDDEPAWMHLSGYSLLGAGSRPAATTAIAEARQGGVQWSVDAASAAPLRELGGDRFISWIEGCDVLFANDDEVATLGGIGRLLRSVRSVVAKHGPGGASWTDGDGSCSAPAMARRVVDTVGAGDAFDAGFIAARVLGAYPQRCLEAGNRAAALVVGIVGARPPVQHP